MATKKNPQARGPMTKKQKVKKGAKYAAKGTVAVYAYRLKHVGGRAAFQAQRETIKSDLRKVGNTRPAVGAAIYADRARTRAGKTKAGAAVGKKVASATTKAKGLKQKMAKRSIRTAAQRTRTRVRGRVPKSVRANMPGARASRKGYGGAPTLGPKNKTGAARAASKIRAKGIRGNASAAKKSAARTAQANSPSTRKLLKASGGARNAGAKRAAAKSTLRKTVRGANRKRGTFQTGVREGRRGSSFVSGSKIGRAGGKVGKGLAHAGRNKGKYGAGAAGAAVVGGAAVYAYKRRKAGKKIIPRRKKKGRG